MLRKSKNPIGQKKWEEVLLMNLLFSELYKWKEQQKGCAHIWPLYLRGVGPRKRVFKKLFSY